MLQNFPKLWVWTIQLIRLECYVMYSITALRFNLRVAYFSWEGMPPDALRRLVLCSVEWIRLLNSYLTVIQSYIRVWSIKFTFYWPLCPRNVRCICHRVWETRPHLWTLHTICVMVCTAFSVHMCYTKSLIHWTLLIILKFVMLYWFKRLNILKSKSQVKFCIWNKTEFSCPITCMHAFLCHKHWICLLKTQTHNRFQYMWVY